MNVMAFEPIKKEQAMNIIYLGDNAEALEWSTTRELKQLCAKYGIRLGDGVRIGSNTTIKSRVIIRDDVNIGESVIIEEGVSFRADSNIGNHVHIGHDGVIGNQVSIKDDVKIGHEVRIGTATTIAKKVRIDNNVHIGEGITIEDGVSLGHHVHLGHYVRIGHGVSIGHNASISRDITIPIRTRVLANHRIERLMTIYNACRYHVSAWIYDNELFIAMDGYTRKESEWDSDFWGNSSEFPEGSEPGDERLEAYKAIIKIGRQIFKEKI